MLAMHCSPTSSWTWTSSPVRSTCSSRSCCGRSWTCWRSTSEVVVSYLDHLESTEALDLEAATEFLVLIAALLELKSRLMLPGADDGLGGEVAGAQGGQLVDGVRARGKKVNKNEMRKGKKKK